MLRGVPHPVPDFDTQPFWDGCANGQFLVQRCAACSAVRWPPGPMCPECQEVRAEWVPTAETGTVYTWVVANHPALPALADQVPYVVGMIDIDGGPRVVGNVVDCNPDEITGGMRVHLFFEKIDSGVTIPNFRRSAREAR